MTHVDRTTRLTTLLGAMLMACASAHAADKGKWQSTASLVQSRAAHAVVGTRTGIYALAGTGPDGPVLDVERFDGRKWAVDTKLPGNGLNAPAAAVVGDRIYLIGGFDTTTNVPTAGVFVYDTRTKAWSDAAPLPAPRGGHAATTWNGRIHVIGGGNSQSTIADHSEYDPATNQWRELAPLPRAEGSPALVAFGDALYAIGGRSGSSDYGDVYVYDARKDRWSAGPAIEPRGTAGAVVYCGAIHVFGGESQEKKSSLGDVFRLDADKGEWSRMTPMPSARNFARAVVYRDRVYVVGGSLKAGQSHSSAGSPVVETFVEKCPGD
ncbi:MAG TPA: kelch repeat-containing protein [Steroidobacteraceae bacterium]|nr:kelch repeat-containing protein [Steroidobacteraceae bacterium]